MLRGSVDEWMAYEDDTEQGLYVMPDGKPFLVYDSSVTPRKYTMYTGNGISTVAEILSGSTGEGITDVQVNGSSVVIDGVAKIPIASENNLGVVKPKSTDGIDIDVNGQLKVNPASNSQIQTATGSRLPITPDKQKLSVFYGLAEVAGDVTQANYAYNDATYPVGTYTDSAKTSILQMLGIVSSEEVEF